MTIFGGIEVLPQLILQWALIPLALMAMLLGTILAIYERDVKVMLAQSLGGADWLYCAGVWRGDAGGVASGIHPYRQSRHDQRRDVYRARGVGAGNGGADTPITDNELTAWQG